MAQPKPRFKVTQYALGDIHIERLPEPDKHPANVFAGGRGYHAPADNPSAEPTPAEAVLAASLAIDPEPVDAAPLSDFNELTPEIEAPVDPIEAQFAALHERMARLEEQVANLLDALNHRAEADTQVVPEADPDQLDEQPEADPDQLDDQPEADPVQVVAPVVIVSEQAEATETPEAQEAQAEQAVAAEAAGVLAVDEAVQGGRRQGAFKRKFAAMREKLAGLRQKRLLRRAVATVALLGVLGAGIYYGIRDNDAEPDTQPGITSVEPTPTTIVADTTSYRDSSSNQLDQSVSPIDSPCSVNQAESLNDSISHRAENTVLICDSDGNIIDINLEAKIEDVNSILQSPEATITPPLPEPDPEPPEGNWKSYQDEQGVTHYSDLEPDPEKVVCINTETGEETDCPF